MTDTHWLVLLIKTNRTEKERGEERRGRVYALLLHTDTFSAKYRALCNTPHYPHHLSIHTYPCIYCPPPPPRCVCLYSHRPHSLCSLFHHQLIQLLLSSTFQHSQFLATIHKLLHRQFPSQQFPPKHLPFLIHLILCLVHHANQHIWPQLLHDYRLSLRLCFEYTLEGDVI